MIDEHLFERGHINIQLDSLVDDFDTLIAEYYFGTVRGYSGEVIDSNGSEYKLLHLDDDEQFIIDFFVYDNEFLSDDGITTTFEKLQVRCTGKIIESSKGYDILDILTYDVITVI